MDASVPELTIRTISIDGHGGDDKFGQRRFRLGRGAEGGAAADGLFDGL